MIESLDVMLWGEKVGTLVSSRENHHNKAFFYFDPAYVSGGYDIAPLRAPIKGVTAQRGLPVYPEEDRIFNGLPSFIADSLPDHWGNTVFNEWAKAHRIRVKELTALDRLAYIGRRGMGALEFIPPMAEEMETPFRVEIADLYELAQRALEQAGTFRAAVSGNLMIESLFKVGTSAGGRRPKAVVNVNFEEGQCYSGQVATPHPGYTPMIIKFDEHLKMPTTRIEYSYYLMAADVGLMMMPSRLLEVETATHFLTERFDRRSNKKVHVQTLAAMQPSADSYEDLFDTAYRIGVPPAELQQLFRLMVMNVLGGNVDDHNKNFSFLMGDDGQWHTAPAYDYTFTVDMDAPYYVNRHSMTVNNKTEDITAEDLMEIARKYGIKAAEPFIKKAIGTVSHYAEYARKAGVGEEWVGMIEREIATRVESLDGKV